MQATDRISLRTTPTAKAVIEQASQLMGVSMSHFILTTVYEKSLKLLKDTPTWSLNAQDSELIQRLLDENGKPNEKMRKLMQLSDGIADNT
ncbi:DUF1778 domain-containing protein [Pasteurellaceae bacterium USgator11]|nr:DUF1778 domain-containing protein [Pasteurellaceae bacterium UScroc12]TNG97763.1 DUF1778 domain-containing protein [Pasteurellaceae bacterium USgator41]TNG99140.1 DUF1778 domain-containing protein [Pasteurellaceae bacterium UScroc31]TNH03057.1 DUF1778 domain-containing protein [Pasteurellaceae bacterium USgator11]